MFRRLWPLIVLLTTQWLSTNAQQLGQNELTDNFIFSVQTIDDFIDRFNFSPSVPAFRLIKSEHPEINFNRSQAVITLFDKQNLGWNTEDVNAFCRQFEFDSTTYLTYNQINWYAVLHTKVVYKHKRTKLDVIMMVEPVVIQNSQLMGYKWSLFSIKAPFWVHQDSILSADDSLKANPAISKEGKFLHPMSHALNFMNIEKIFHKGMTQAFFARKANSPDLRTLVKLVDTDQIRFLQVDNVSYHFLQLPGWIFKVDYYDRNTPNSGWLISKLIRSSSIDKKEYQLKNLNIK